MINARNLPRTLSQKRCAASIDFFWYTSSMGILILQILVGVQVSPHFRHFLIYTCSSCGCITEPRTTKVLLELDNSGVTRDLVSAFSLRLIICLDPCIHFVVVAAVILGLLGLVRWSRHR